MVTAMAVAMATTTPTIVVAIIVAVGREAFLRAITLRPVETSAPMATDWKLSVKRETAIGAAPRWTILTSARARLPMTMAVWYVVVVVTTMADTGMAATTVDIKAGFHQEPILRPAATSA